MIALGLMSGTSLDGIDAAAIEIEEPTAGARPAVRLVAHRHAPFAPDLRDAALAIASGEPTSARDVALLHGAIGDAYADVAAALAGELAERPALAAMHGQTIAHLPEGRVTLQLGDPARVASRAGVPTIADFRGADVAAGGQGAPLVPFADHVLFAGGAPRALLNLGGIANLTLLPTERADDVVAFDTGPGNIVSDALAAVGGMPFDRDGARAARGHVELAALERALADPYFARRAPKSTGREQFGKALASALLADVERSGGGLDDALATAVELTARSVARGLERETPGRTGWRELAVGGGGARNAALMAALARAVAPLAVRSLDELGIPAEAREAVAFAILGAYRLRGLPNTLPRCTGARRAVSAGALYLP